MTCETSTATTPSAGGKNALLCTNPKYSSARRAVLYSAGQWKQTSVERVDAATTLTSPPFTAGHWKTNSVERVDAKSLPPPTPILPFHARLCLRTRPPSRKRTTQKYLAESNGCINFPRPLPSGSGCSLPPMSQNTRRLRGLEWLYTKNWREIGGLSIR